MENKNENLIVGAVRSERSSSLTPEQVADIFGSYHREKLVNEKEVVPMSEDTYKERIASAYGSMKAEDLAGSEKIVVDSADYRRLNAEFPELELECKVTKEQIEEAISDPDKYDSVEGVRFTNEPDFNGLASLDLPGPYTSMGMVDTNVPIVKPNRITGEGRMKCRGTSRKRPEAYHHQKVHNRKKTAKASRKKNRK